ncbi:DNA topoisomerase 2-binding protein 1 isoform X3 [Brachypodium distachyon]|uniref:DNA topoisomerase 2-binding protein 1 isoform X3 n=1 Tax=Brachypodium distachyon TaxID=15368 RepID=UPI000D0D8264|nr:DNA topoisomerase 2-binding protein 1 isoform X3 [Brachypodium distachyon]|eukprot:XP_024310454.1 DNA topoisomerase 2-binding protein 1 isoform X3 [Brachypodium distachyon]
MTPSHPSPGAGPASTSSSAGRRTATFAGASVFLSRNLVAPEVFDAVHDALRFNGAEVFLSSDPGRAGPLDYHVISSSSHERFADLKAKGCNLLGPQCILSCAKERRSLPKQGYTCCLAMDGVKILCSGFEKDEKAKIEQLVEAMGGLLQAKVSMDINFVIAKDVSAAKYKWALNILKKPIVSMNWLEQCWIEHRVVPHEPYRILPFTGLTICFTKLDADKRMELKEVILQNGGQYSATLTKKCTHLVATEPGSDKYVVAKKWGHILIVDRRWIDQSVARRACLDENAYLISESSTTFKGIRGSAKEQRNPEISGASFQPVPAASVDDSVSTSQYVQASGDASKICSSDVVGAPSVQETNEMQVDSHVAEDSEAEDDDLYLSNCRISLVGFEEKELSRLVTMIRDGGGSRHVMLSERLTHIILGAPSEDREKKEVRRLAAWGVINVVKVTWLEDCNKAKKEVKVSATHLASDLLLKEFPFLSMDKSSDTRETKAAKSLCGMFHVPAVNDSHDKQQVKDLSSERKLARGRHENMNNTQTTTRSAKSSQQSGELSSERKPARGKHENMNNTRTTTRSAKSSQQSGETSIGKATSSAVNLRSSSSNIFNGRTFCFSKSFSHDRRAEVVDWLRKGGGMLVDDAQTVVDFIIECHGQNNMQCDFSHSTFVSTQWIASCLEVGYMQDVGSHPIFSPLLCRIPFPGFEDFRFCVSQYEEKDRILLKNLCLTLGAKFTDKATNKVTHLICKFASGPKYEAFHKRGVPTITVEWLFECVRQDTIIPFDQFLPKPPTSQDRDTGLCTVSQFPTQAANTTCKFDCPEPLSEFQVPRGSSKHSSGSSVSGDKNSSSINKRRRLETSSANETSGTVRTEKHADTSSVPAVADSIEDLEDLLVQSSKNSAPADSVVHQDEEHRPLPACTYIPYSDKIENHSNNWPQKQGSPTGKNFLGANSIQAPAPSPSPYLTPFSETQSESQIVGYEEDFTGIQKIIDRVSSQKKGNTIDRVRSQGINQ